MFACQNFLKQSCIKFYKEQKLFHCHLMKMITTCSKSAYKADLWAVLTLSKILLSPGATSLPDRFWKISLYPSRFGLCSSWQTCRTRLVLQEYQLHHLLIHHGLEVIQRLSSSIRQAMQALMVSSARRRGRPAQHLAAIWRPYAGASPTRQVIDAVMDATTPRTRPAPIHSLPPSLSRLRRRKRHRHCRRELRELLAPSPLRLASPPSVSVSASSSSIFSTSWLAEISPRWAAFCEIAVVGFTAIATPIPANLAAAPSLSPFFSLSHVSTCLGWGCGPCHDIPALLPPSCGNTATAPPHSPPTATPYVSRLTRAIRVRCFYLESSVLSHWCLSHPSPTLYRSEMSGWKVLVWFW